MVEKSTPADNGYLSDLHARRSEEKAQDLQTSIVRRFLPEDHKKEGRSLNCNMQKMGSSLQKWSLLQFENMKLQTISENLECSSTNHRDSLQHQHLGESFGASIPREITRNSLGVRLQEEEQLFQPTSIIPS